MVGGNCWRFGELRGALQKAKGNCRLLGGIVGGWGAVWLRGLSGDQGYCGRLRVTANHYGRLGGTMGAGRDCGMLGNP